MDKVEAVTDDDEWQLVGEFGFLFVSGEKDTRLSKTIQQQYSSHKTNLDASFNTALGIIIYMSF